MEAERVKTKKVSAADRIPEKTGRKKWSVLFLESLLKEAKEREAESEKARPAVDGESWIRPGRDTFEHSEDPEELWCESYEDIMGIVRMVGKWKANILYQIANAILRDYHEKKLDEDGVGELFGLCCQKCKDTGGGTGRKTEPQITETVLEFFLRANARMSVFSMERAGKRLTARCGLNWSGTTYYDAWYFYRCAQMHRRLFVVAGRIAAELGEKVSSPEELEQRTQFAAVGGLTFHGVFGWVQQKDNYPVNQYGLKNPGIEPLHHFVYLYRNHYSEAERPCVQFLETLMREQTACAQRKELWRHYTIQDGREYHNGMSYLLEGSLADEQDEKMYEAALLFLQNFRLYRVDGCVEFLYTAYEKEWG